MLSYEQTTVRITEDIIIRGTTTHRSLLKDFAISPPSDGDEEATSEPHALLLPVMTPRRTTVVDFLSVEDSEGNTLPVLRADVSESIGRWILLVAFDAWVEALFPKDDSDPSLYREGAQLLERLKRNIVSLPAAETGTDDVAAAGESIVQVTTAITGNTDEVAEADLLIRALHLYCTRRPILTLTPRSAEPRLMVSLRISYRSHGRQRMGTQIAALLRRAIGQRPSSHFIPTPHAYYCQSYYARIEAPIGHYVSLVDFVRPKSDVRDDRYTSLDRADVPSQDYSPTGLPYAHARLRDTSDSESLVARTATGAYTRAPLGLRVTFHEVPPGSIGLALTISLLAILAVGSVGLVLGDLLTSNGGGSSDVPALLVTAPGIAGLVFGPSLEWDRLVSAPMLARISLVATGVAAFMAGGIYIVAAASYGPTDDLDGLAWPLVAWRLLLVLLAVQTLALFWSWIRAHKAYGQAIRSI